MEGEKLMMRKNGKWKMRVKDENSQRCRTDVKSNRSANLNEFHTVAVLHIIAHKKI